MVSQILLTQGKIALVDDADYECVSPFKWSAVYRKKLGRWYARRCGDKEGRHNLYLHQQVLEYYGSLEIDHRDSDGLNNQRANIRLATKSQNNANRGLLRTNKSGYKGVFFQMPHRKWSSSITANGRRFFLGLYDDPEDAARAYDAAALQHFGDFARTNEMLGNFAANRPVREGE